jgi:ribose transport system permease protein
MKYRRASKIKVSTMSNLSAMQTDPARSFRLPIRLDAAMPAAILVLLFAVQILMSPTRFSYFDLNYISAGGTALSLAAMGLAIIVVSGGLDLSAGATISLVNIVLATQMQNTPLSQAGYGILALLIGAAVGAFNGFFVAVLRIPSIVVTISSMVIVQGMTLLVSESPAGSVPEGFKQALAGSAIPGILPMPLVILAIAAAVWLYLKNTRWGTALYAIGSDEEGAKYSGVSVPVTRFLAFVVGGMFYGAAGAFITAQTGSGDPLVGNPMLLTIFAAVVVGGTSLEGGRGGCISAIIGAYVLRVAGNLLLIVGVSSYFGTLVESLVLLVAAFVQLAGTQRSSDSLRALSGGLRKVFNRSQRTAFAAPKIGLAVGGPASNDRSYRGFFERHSEFLRMSAPAAIGLVVVLVATVFYLGIDRVGAHYLSSVLVLSSFLILLAFGQGVVVISGGLDLSIPWTITFCAIALTSLAPGDNSAAVWVIPLVLFLGVLIGACNGVLVALLRLPAIVATLGMNGILQTIALLYCNGTPSGFAPPVVRWFMNRSLLGVKPVVWFLVAFVLLALFVLTRTVFGRRLYALGSNRRAAYLSGVNVDAALVLTYVISGVCSAIVGIFLAGFDGQATLGMGDAYLLPSIAVVVVGGTLVTGGRGHFLSMVLGVLFLVTLQVLLAGSNLPNATRSIVFGAVIIAAVVALNERRTT